eukprot:7479735-Pyramimonas_sp.AAC.1
MPPASPVVPWDEASAAGRCTVQDAVAAATALGWWPMSVPVRCGEKEGVLMGCFLVRSQRVQPNITTALLCVSPTL